MKSYIAFVRESFGALTFENITGVRCKRYSGGNEFEASISEFANLFF